MTRIVPFARKLVAPLVGTCVASAASAAPINIPQFVTATVAAPAAVPQNTKGQAIITVGLSQAAPAGSQVTTTMLNWLADRGVCKWRLE